MVRMQVGHRVVLDLELLLGVPDDSWKIDGEMDVVGSLLVQDDVSKVLSILLELIELVVKTHLHLSIISDLLGNLRVHKVGEDSLNFIGVLVLGSEAGMTLKLIIVIVHEVDLHVLDVLSGKTILSIEELNNLVL